MNKQLLQARIARRWTITVAAQRIGIGRSTYVRWEQGLQFPRQSGLMLACKAFNLSPEQLGFPLVAPYEVPSDALALPLSPALRQETMWRLNTQTFLDQQEETAKLAGQQKIVYACLEVEIMAMALHWKKSSGSLLVLQQLISESIRKYDAMHQDDTRQETGLTRRQALQAIALLPIQLYGLTHLPRLASQLSPEEMLPLCAAGLTACADLRQYEPEGIYAIGRILSAYLPTLEELARQSAPSQRPAAHLAAQGYLLAGALAEYAGKLDQLEAASRMARFYGQIANDPNLEVAALIRLAVKYDLEYREATSLETYQEILTLSGFQQSSPLLQGKVYCGLAGTHAYCGQQSEALSFLSRAKEIFPKDTQAILLHRHAVPQLHFGKE